MTYLKLFWAFFQIGLLSFGGGYAALPLIQDQVVTGYGWLTMNEFADIITISQMTPGPIALNTATFVGTRVAGIWGAIISTFGCVLAPSSIALLLAVLYQKYKNLKYAQGVLKGLHPAVVGMIGSAGFSILVHALWGESPVFMGLGGIDLIAAAIIVLCVVLLRKTKLSPILLMLGAGVAGGLLYTFL